MKLLSCATVICLALMHGAFADPLNFTSVVGGIATGPNLNLVTFDGSVNLPPGVGLNLSNADIVAGSVAGQYAAPYLSGAQASFFGQTNGPDSTNYIAVGKGGSATFTFQMPQSYFGVLWGSVDSYNALSFYSRSTLVGTISGADIEVGANGDQGLNGTYYLNVFSTLTFDEVIASSAGVAFEFDDVAYDPPPSIPEPSSLAILLSAIGVLVTFGLHGAVNAAPADRRSASKYSRYHARGLRP